MEDVDRFLVEKYSEYREALGNVPFFEPSAPYGWLQRPKTIDLLYPHGMGPELYCDIWRESAKSLANSINGLINVTRRLEAWQVVIEGLERREKFGVVQEFVSDLATVGMMAPYSIKERFFFASAHLSHQANRVWLGPGWVDDFETLPEDGRIGQKEAIEHSKPWASWEKLEWALNKVDGHDFKTATDGFRNKHTHRLAPYVAFGITQTTKRTRSQDSAGPQYQIFGGSAPLSLVAVIATLKPQCRYLSVCFTHFQALVVEQSGELFATP